MKLYEITEQCRGLMDIADDLPEEAFNDTLEALSGEFDEKAISVGYVIKNLAIEAEAIDMEIKRLSARKKARDNRVKSLKGYLLTNMVALDKKKVHCEIFSLSRRKGHMSVVIDNQDVLTESYTKVSVSPDKVAIKKAIDAGKEVEGAHLERGNDSLVMR